MRDEDISPDEKVSLGELEEALSRLGYGYSSLTGPKLVSDVLAHREPAWHAGDVVRDADGVVWSRRYDRHWIKMGIGGSWVHEAPVRPLRKLEEKEA